MKRKGTAVAVVNGEDRPDVDGATLLTCLERAGLEPGRVACELNGAVVPRVEYESRVLGISDELEIVRFVGGG